MTIGYNKNQAGPHFDDQRQTSYPNSNTRIDLMDDWERSELLHMLDFAKLHRELHEQLFQLVERGPIWDGDVVSKTDRSDLIDVGACSKVCVKGEQGFNAATYFGWRLLAVFEWLHGPLVNAPERLRDKTVSVRRKKLAAQAIEARQGGDEGSIHDSAVAEGDVSK